MGHRIPYVGHGADGARRSAQIDRSEADTFDPGEERDRCLASAERWEQQAAELEARAVYLVVDGNAYTLRGHGPALHHVPMSPDGDLLWGDAALVEVGELEDIGIVELALARAVGGIRRLHEQA